MGSKLLEVTGLKKYYKSGRNNTVIAVDDVSFSISEGETLGLVGESGCGKTTIARSIMGISEIDAGRIIFNGIDIRQLTKINSRKIQMVFQDTYSSLNPFLTVGEIISDGLKIHKMCASKKETSDRVTGLLDKVGLHMGQMNCFPYELSGGQRQRVGIARALAVNPNFIVCDEIISALDVSIQAQIINMLLCLQNDLNLTYLFISHDLSMVHHIADYIAVMYLGKIVEYGSSDEDCLNPYHPYTKDLLASIPLVNPVNKQSAKIRTSENNSTNPSCTTYGCRFFSTCKEVTRICSAETPQLVNKGMGHMVACHNAKILFS